MEKSVCAPVAVRLVSTFTFHKVKGQRCQSSKSKEVIMNEGNDAEDLMDVEFPVVLNASTRSSNNDDNDDENNNSTERAPLIDIRTDGWDNDAILNCLERTCALHDYSLPSPSSSSKNDVGRLDFLRQFEFVVRPNKRFERESSDDVVAMESVTVTVVATATATVDSDTAIDIDDDTDKNQSIPCEETSRQDGAFEKGQPNKELQLDTSRCSWKPSSLPMPSWASDPVTRL